MKEFKSIDTTHITGRGPLIVVHVPNPNMEMRPEGLPELGEVVLIDDKKYHVRGIEASKKLMDPPYLDEMVGLIVYPVDE